MKNLTLFNTRNLCILFTLFLTLSQAQSLESKIDKILSTQFKTNETGVSASC